MNLEEYTKESLKTPLKFEPVPSQNFQAFKSKLDSIKFLKDIRLNVASKLSPIVQLED